MEENKSEVDEKEVDEVVELPVSIVKPNENQPRKNFDKEKLEELGQSIVNAGLVNPIQVRKIGDGREYEIISGERRWRAHKLEGLKKIKAIIKDIDVNQSSVESLIENIQRENLSLEELGQHLKKIKEEEGINTFSALGRRVGMKLTHIQDALRFVGLNEEVKEVAKGLTDTAVIEVVSRIKDNRKRIGLLKRVKKEGWSPTHIRKVVNAVTRFPREVSTAIIKGDVTPEQGKDISKLKKETQRVKAIVKHKGIKESSKNVVKVIKKESKENGIQAKNIITSFRENSLESTRAIDRALKVAMVCSNSLEIMDDKNMKKLESYLALWETTLANARNLIEDIQEQVNKQGANR